MQNHATTASASRKNVSSLGHASSAQVIQERIHLVFESRVELHQPTKMVINRNSTTVVVFPKVINCG
jgi:hypothetical protein